MFPTIVPLFSTVLFQGCDAIQDWLRPKPNVVFHHGRYTATRSIGIYGHDKATSPSLDAYASKRYGL